MEIEEDKKIIYGQDMYNILVKTLRMLNDIPNTKTYEGSTYDLASEIGQLIRTINEEA